MRTEQLIADLAARATPVRPLPAPFVRLLGWLTLAIACAATGLFAFGVKPDLAAVIGESDFIWTAVLGVATIVVAGAAAVVLAIPGAERSPTLRVITLQLLAVWACVLVITIIRTGHGFSGASDWYVCVLRVVLIASIPAVTLMAMLRRSAPLRPGWTSAVAMAAAAATGAVAIQFICPVNDPAHALLGHFGPVAALTAIGAAAARRLLRP